MWWCISCLCLLCLVVLLLLLFAFKKWFFPTQVCVYEFVDNSNFSIGAQDNDKNFLVNLKELKRILSRNHSSEAIIYGSNPADTKYNSFWTAAKNAGFQVKTFERSHKEKEVDVAIGCDIVEKLYTKKNIVIAIVSGDRDMRPAIMKCLEKGVPVELWAFEESLSKCFNNLKDTLFSVHLLDYHRDVIAYKPTKQN